MTAEQRKAALAALPARSRLLRRAYYALFWYVPYRQFSPKARRYVRRFHVVVFGLGAAAYATSGDWLGAALFLAGMVLSHSSLQLVDRSIEAGHPVPRTPWNLPADLEPPPPSVR